MNVLSDRPAFAVTSIARPIGLNEDWSPPFSQVVHEGAVAQSNLHGEPYQRTAERVASGRHEALAGGRQVIRITAIVAL